MTNDFLSSTKRLLNACSEFYPAPSPQYAPPSSFEELARVVAQERLGELDRLLTQAEKRQSVTSDSSAETLARCQQRARRLTVYRLLSESGIELSPEMVKEKDELEDRIGRTADLFADRHPSWVRDTEKQVRANGVAVLDEYPQPPAKEAAPAETLERCQQEAKRLLIYRFLSQSIELSPEMDAEKKRLEDLIGRTADLFAETNRDWMRSTNQKVRANGAAVLDKYPQPPIKAAKRNGRLAQRAKRLLVYRCLCQHGFELSPVMDAEKKHLENRVGRTANTFAEKHQGFMRDIDQKVQTNGADVLNEYPLS